MCSDDLSRMRVPQVEPVVESFLSLGLPRLLESNGLVAGIICIKAENDENYTIVCAHGLPKSPFQGSRKEQLAALIQDCFQKHPAPHIHSISGTPFWKELGAVCRIEDWQPRVSFIPAHARGVDLVALLFAKNGNELPHETGTLTYIYELLDTLAAIVVAEETSRRLAVMQAYVKEVGHDIASSVQAVIAKLRNVSKGLVDGRAALEKVREAEEEIMSAYRVADTLGITVDPNYNIAEGNEFDLRDAVEAVKKLCASEAAERHIELRTESPERAVRLWGDEKAIQSALTQLLMNAIKYAFGSSYVTIGIKDYPERVQVSVNDVGTALDEEEIQHMWEFGFRGRRALELHVNGSGIGLFTVKKVVKAHGGTVFAKSGKDSGNFVVFGFSIPKRELLNKTLLLGKS